MDFSAEQAAWIVEPYLGVPIWRLQIFFLEGYVKYKIFHNPPNTTDELKLRNTEAINATEPQTLRKVFRNMQKRVSACLRNKAAILSI